MVELFHTPVGPRRHDAHAPNRQQAQKPEDGDDDDHAHRFLLAQDRRFSYAVLSTRTPSDTIMGGSRVGVRETDGEGCRKLPSAEYVEYP